MVRAYTTERLFEETFQHFSFACKIIDEHGKDFDVIIAAARGELPFKKSNRFLEGFINWKAVNRTEGWDDYMVQITGDRVLRRSRLQTALYEMGIEVVRFEDWPGFEQNHFDTRNNYTERIRKIQEQREISVDSSDFGFLEDVYRKATPEAEAILIIKNEREGAYHVSPTGSHTSHDAWFISNTSVLNHLGLDTKITWRPELFLKYASSLCPASDERSAELAFETILLGIAQSGVSLLDEATMTTVFGGGIDQSTLDYKKEKELYARTLSGKYATPLDDAVIDHLPPSSRPLVTLQLTRELLRKQSDRLKQAHEENQGLQKRLTAMEKEVKSLSGFKKKQQARKAKKRPSKPSKAKKDRPKRKKRRTK